MRRSIIEAMRSTSSASVACCSSAVRTLASATASSSAARFTSSSLAWPSSRSFCSLARRQRRRSRSAVAESNLPCAAMLALAISRATCWVSQSSEPSSWPFFTRSPSWAARLAMIPGSGGIKSNLRIGLGKTFDALILHVGVRCLRLCDARRCHRHQRNLPSFKFIIVGSPLILMSRAQTESLAAGKPRCLGAFGLLLALG